MSNVLDIAMAAFEDEKSPLTLEEKISGLRRALSWNVLQSLKKVIKGEKLSGDEDYKHTECMRYLGQLEKIYASEARMNKQMLKSGKVLPDMDRDYLKRIKEENGSVGGIVRDIQPIGKAK